VRSESAPPERKKASPMIYVLALIALLVTALAFQRGVGRQGLVESARLFVQMGPVLLPAFVLAGMMTAAGALTPGGPFIAFPLLAVLLKGGASVGAITAYLSAWALLGVHRVIAFEIPILGWRFAAVRCIASLLAPVVIGFLAQLLSSKAT
jgi:hypothetical protein